MSNRKEGYDFLGKEFLPISEANALPDVGNMSLAQLSVLHGMMDARNQGLIHTARDLDRNGVGNGIDSLDVPVQQCGPFVRSILERLGINETTDRGVTFYRRPLGIMVPLDGDVHAGFTLSVRDERNWRPARNESIVEVVGYCSRGSMGAIFGYRDRASLTHDLNDSDVKLNNARDLISSIGNWLSYRVDKFFSAGLLEEVIEPFGKSLQP